MNPWTSFTWHQLGLALLIGLAISEPNLYLVTAVLHRGLCHRSLVFSRWLTRIVAVWLWVTVYTSCLNWVAAHSHHHAYSDTREDPHSPAYKGFWRVLLLTWYYVPRWSRKNRQLAQQKYLKPFRQERLLRTLDSRFMIALNFFSQALASLALGPVALTFWVSRLAPYILASGYVNAAGHTAGVQPYGAVGTDSAGLFQTITGYVIGGEPLGHNFHHHNPSSPTFRPNRFDPGLWFAVWILAGVPTRALPTKRANI